MKKSLCTLLFISAACCSFSQRSLNYNLYELIHQEDVKSSPVQFQSQYAGILGTAFLTDEWVSGRAFTMMKMYPVKKMKFDVYKNKMYVNTNDTIYDMSSSGIIQFDIFPVANDTANKISFNNGYNIEEITPEKYVQVISDGKISFIKYYRKNVEEVYESSPSYKEKKFLDENKYFIIEEGQPGKEITVSKKNLEKILAAKWDEISKYAKSNSISTGREDGWKKLIDYYNSL